MTQPSDPGQQPANQPVRILVVDDNRDSADTLAVMLEVFGYETRTAYDGEVAITVAAEFHPAAILLDVGMPKVTGLDVCRSIRQELWGKSILIIAQSGWGQEADQKLTREAGFDHHLVKPIDPDALLERLTSLTKQ